MAWPPVCRDQFRAGFTRCEGCDADLVEELDSGTTAGSRSGSLAPDLSGPRADYCGFLEMTEALEARDLLWNNGLVSEVVVRPAQGCLPGQPLQEEFWLRVPAGQIQAVTGLLGFHEAEDLGFEAPESTGERRCSGCGAGLPGEERFCPHCGAGR
jgi:hypothetical protein